jgi:hypothetical protein
MAADDPALLQRERVGGGIKYCWDLKDYLPALGNEIDSRARLAPRMAR